MTLARSDTLAPGGRLLVSIHDVGPTTSDAVVRLKALLEPLLGGPRIAMLVVPDHWGMGRIDRDPAFAARLRGWADAGIEMFLHGWYHRDDTPHDDRWSRFKATRMTAGEGEFLGLDAAEAGRRLHDGRAMVEDAIGRSIAGFVAPAWLYGDGAHAALRAAGIAMAEDHMRVWDPRDGRVLARGPVVTWANRTRARTASSLAVAAAARRGLGWLPVARVAVHPGDTTKPGLVASIEKTVVALAARRRIARYAELAA